jgi:hypothetical protein
MESLFSVRKVEPPTFPVSFGGQLACVLLAEAFAGTAIWKLHHKSILVWVYVAVGVFILIKLILARRRNTREAYSNLAHLLWTLLLVQQFFDLLR